MDINQKVKLAQIKNSKRALLQGDLDISLTTILSSEQCQDILSECREFRERVYSPIKTVFMFVKQVLNPDKSCRNAVAGAVAEQLSLGEEGSSTNTGPYCRARERLPEIAVKSLVQEVGQSAAANALKSWKFHGHEVKLVDGNSVLMPDTKENQTVFPQHSNQKKGAGFPLARMVTIMSLTTGTVIDYAIDAYKGKGTGEQSLLRAIFNCINSGDILLGDRYYPSFFCLLIY